MSLLLKDAANVNMSSEFLTCDDYLRLAKRMKISTTIFKRNRSILYYSTPYTVNLYDTKFAPSQQGSRNQEKYGRNMWNYTDWDFDVIELRLDSMQL